MTSLHHAARHNQPAIIQLLVRAGLPVDTKGKQDATFLKQSKGGSFEVWPCHLPSNLLISSGGINFVTLAAKLCDHLAALFHKILKFFRNKVSFKYFSL